MRFYLTRLLIHNMVFVFLIAAVTYVFASRKIGADSKHGLMLAKFGLFLSFLMLVYVFDEKGSNFAQKKSPDQLPDFLALSPRFSLELMDATNRTASLDHELAAHRSLTVLGWKNSADAESLLQSALRRNADSSRVVFLKYKDDKRSYEQMAPHILQSLKKETLGYKTKTNTTLVLEELPKQLYEIDFLDLLTMIGENVPELRFVVLESNRENLHFLREKYKQLNIKEVTDMDPEVFKSMAIDIILRGFYNKLSDVQAAKAAHELYSKKGASLKELAKLYKKYS